MQPDVPDTHERLRYVFRMYAEPETDRNSAAIGFPHFIRMVRHIHRYRGEPTDDESVEAAALKVFELSHLDVEDGFITESQFVAASMAEGDAGFKVRELSHVWNWSELGFLRRV